MTRSITPNSPALPDTSNRLLTNEDFHRLSEVPPEVDWFANINNAQNRRSYENDFKDFMAFTGIVRPEEFRNITRAHIIAWRDELASRNLSGMTIRHRLAALSSLFEYLCEKNTVTHNPVKGVKRPAVESYEGKTPALGDHQARKLLDIPDGGSLKGSVAKNPHFILISVFGMEKSDERFQMAALPGRYNLGLCPVVLQIRNQLSRSGGNDVRTWT